MLRLRCDSEILAAAAALWLRLSGQNGMPNISQTTTSGAKTIKTRRKINIFRIELSTEAPTGEEPFAKSSFYLNKTHIFEIGRARQKITIMGDNSKTAQRLPQYTSDFIKSRHTRFWPRKKLAPLCGEMRVNFRAQNQDALLNATTARPKFSKTLFGDHGRRKPTRADMVLFGTEWLRAKPPSQHGWPNYCLRKMHGGGPFV